MLTKLLILKTINVYMKMKQCMNFRFKFFKINNIFVFIIEKGFFWNLQKLKIKFACLN